MGFRTLVSLALCALCAGAAFAHFAIDVVGDYALPRDSYDHLRHGSRDVVTAIAFVLAAVLAARGLRACCEIAAANRARLRRPALPLRNLLAILGCVLAASITIVPAMEYLDGLLDGVPVRRLGDAFGGSIPLGIGTTLICCAFVAVLVFALARWLISHRDSIAIIIEALSRRDYGAVRPSAYDLFAQLVTPRRRRTPTALRLSKRGPPLNGFA